MCTLKNSISRKIDFKPDFGLLFLVITKDKSRSNPRLVQRLIALTHHTANKITKIRGYNKKISSLKIGIFEFENRKNQRKKVNF